MILIDTNIIIYYLQGEVKSSKQFQNWRDSREDLAVSIITEMELLSFPKITDEETTKINEFLREFRIFYLDEKIALAAAQLRRQSKNRILLADSVIAATAIINNCVLATRNSKHFKAVDGLTIKTV